MFIELCERLEPGSGSGIGNKAIIISAKQQSHTEEYCVVYGSSNHTRKNSGFKDNGAHERKGTGNPAGSVYVCF